MDRMGFLLLIAAACHATTVPEGSPDARTVDARATRDATGDASGAGGSLYPLAIGYSWTYAITGTCSPSDQKTIVSATPVDGRPAFQLSACSITVNFSTPGGDEVDVYAAGSWLVLVDPMLVEGHSWIYYTTTFTWHRETSVTVPAGTFTDCWTAVPDVAGYPMNTYCRGVGPVHLTSSTSDQLLTGKNF